MKRICCRHSIWARVGATIVLLLLMASTPGARADDESSALRELSPHLAVYQGPINVGILHAENSSLLIDCGDGSVADALPSLGVQQVERILFTHHHRDQACGAPSLIKAGAKVVVPAAERDWFADVGKYWNDRKSRWDIYNFHPHRLMLTESIPVADTVAPGDQLTWHDAMITVLATPGHTDGSVSYCVEVDGRRVIFCGDVIYDTGQIWDIHSLQKGFQRGERRISDYHGFLGAQDELRASLDEIRQAAPDMLVPSHGNVMDDPAAAIDALLARLDQCYDRYVGISALRHYFPELFEAFEGRPGHMPIGPDIEVPPFLRHFGTSWVVVSEEKAAFVLDAGHRQRVADLQKLIDAGEIGSVDGLWITHYHNDHTAAIPEFLNAFGCPCYADRHVAEVITDPMAWRIPCISPAVAKVEHVLEHGQSWQWHEFKMTSYHLPGQTRYHGGLLVEGHGTRLFFVGDSFTAAGIDDYCALNRNWLGPGVGFNACFDLMQEIKPTHLFNCHVAKAFNFTPDQYQHMRANLTERERLFGDLVPWPHANYGMDESWIRTFPYEQAVAAGTEVAVDVIVTNHSANPQPTAARLIPPSTWQAALTSPKAWTSIDAPAKAESSLTLRLTIPPDTPAGRYPVAIDIRHGSRLLPQFSETVLVVE